MTEAEAVIETKKIFGEHSFAESDDHGEGERFYVGALPTQPGRYVGYMGLTWEGALTLAKRDQIRPIFYAGPGVSMHSAVTAIAESAPMTYEALNLLVGNCMELERVVRDLTLRIIMLETPTKGKE